MAGSHRAAPRRGFLQYVLIGASVLAALVAVLPIAFAIFGGIGAVKNPRTAFASSPPGDYAVVARTEGNEDVIAVAPLHDPARTTEVARVAHLDGYSTNGAVSPDGKRVALIVPNAGSQSRASAELVVVTLESGEQVQTSKGLDPQQTPLWDPDSGSVMVVRNDVDADGRGKLAMLKVAADGSGEQVLKAYGGILGVYPAGFDAQARFLSVIIDGRGSTLVRDGTEVGNLSSQITRDWRVSTDGTQLAYIESNLDGGLHYVARVFALDGGSGMVTAQALSDGSQQLGVAWKPGAASPTVGHERGDARSAGVMAQSLSTADSATRDGFTTAGFDVPIAYSADGVALAVTHWSGPSFEQAGEPSLQLLTDDARTTITTFTRFMGWAAR